MFIVCFNEDFIVCDVVNSDVVKMNRDASFVDICSQLNNDKSSDAFIDEDSFFIELDVTSSDAFIDEDSCFIDLDDFIIDT